MRQLNTAAKAALGHALAAAVLLLAGCGGGTTNGGTLAGTANSAEATADTPAAATPDTTDTSAATPATIPVAPASDPAGQAPAANDPPGPPSTADAGDDTSRSQAASYTVDPKELVVNGQYAAGATGWTLQDAVLVPSELRSGGSALNIGWQATQAFAPAALQAGRSYTLLVKARTDRTGASATVTMRFRKPKNAESVRTWKASVASTAFQTYRIDFTAPNYVGMADVIVAAGGGARLIVDSVSLKMRGAIAPTEWVSSWANSYAPPGYALAFNDEFNGTALNRAKWFTRYINGNETQDHLNDEQQRYRDNDNHVVANGVLNLVARKVSSSDPAGVNYESGMIRSDWTARYGYFEARVKMPGGLGVWPAFWLNSDVGSDGRLAWPPEIDIFEFVNNGVEDRVNMLHSNVVRQTAATTSTLLYADPSFNATLADHVASFNYDEGWHTIGMEWTPTDVTLYVDGRKIYTRTYTWTYADGTLAAPAHILLNLAIGGSWAARHGIDDSKFPQALQIDWVRAYQRSY